MNIKYDVLEPLSCNDLLNDFIKSDHVTMQIDYDTREECEKAYEAFRKARTRYKYEVTFSCPKNNNTLYIKKVEFEPMERDAEYDAWVREKRKHHRRYNANVRKFKEQKNKN